MTNVLRKTSLVFIWLGFAKKGGGGGVGGAFISYPNILKSASRHVILSLLSDHLRDRAVFK